MVPFLSLLIRAYFAFISWVPSLPSNGTQSSGQGYLFGMMWRLLTPRALRCHPRSYSPPGPGVNHQALPCVLNAGGGGDRD